MNRPLLRFAVAALIVVLGIWCGAHLYSKRAAARLHGPGIAVPVGEASAPTASDFLPGFDASTPPPVKIPDRLPDFSLKDRDGKATSIKDLERQIPGDQLLGHVVRSMPPRNPAFEDSA